MGSVLGINSAYHESAACILRDGELVAFAEEERFNRRKHGKPALVDNPDDLPRQAMEYCLREAGIAWRDLDAIGYSFQPAERRRNVGLGEPVIDGGWGSASGEALFQERLQAIPALLSALGGADLRSRFQWLDHHLCHAASAFLVSPFEEAAVLSLDGIGEFDTVWLGHGRETELRPLAHISYPHSLGFLWEKLAEFLGFSCYDACKIMALAGYGDPAAFAEGFARLVSNEGQDMRPKEHPRPRRPSAIRDSPIAPVLRLDAECLRFRSGDFSPLEKLLGPRRLPGQPLESRHYDIAAALQRATERAILNLADSLRQRTGSPRLCLAGGVALNCLCNRVLQESGLFEEIFIQPAAHDAGTALGAALWLWTKEYRGSRQWALEHPYYGPECSQTQTLAALRQHSRPWRMIDDPSSEAARLIADGLVVGWFQGRMEAGPRALGNRSLLADPRRAEIRAVLNEKIKHRATFQPFAPAVLAERASEWFQVPTCTRTRASDFMLVAYSAQPGVSERIPAVVHVDGTSRLQTVRAQTNPLFHRLISEFERRTGVPLVLNTSFNDSEPIVCTPEDALRTFEKSDIDALVMGSFLVRREETR